MNDRILDALVNLMAVYVRDEYDGTKEHRYPDWWSEVSNDAEDRLGGRDRFHRLMKLVAKRTLELKP